ncbi:MAG TPA: YggS family pyridoxal phosphate-dependent enzyme [Terriglobales bacterium]|nr:YggS family pyridoxal phosphate-dependent enzyme [Terriglobales bacterium]
MIISFNLSVIHDRVAHAAKRTGRNASEIALMAVTKTFPADLIIEAYHAGQRLFGENRVQEFAEKVGGLAQLQDAEFHMIGHLQSNKAAKAAEIFHAIDSLDSAKLAQRLDAAAEKLGKILDVLIEINLGGEEAKSGIAPDSLELEAILSGASSWRNLRIRGLMTVPPFTEDPEGARSYFRQLRELRDRLAARSLPSVSLDILSMGMSHDFEVAIEEGSTCVRLGTAIFGTRAKP